MCIRDSVWCVFVGECVGMLGGLVDFICDITDFYKGIKDTLLTFDWICVSLYVIDVYRYSEYFRDPR